jgi:flagellar biosynthesis chaperone FliJ
MPARKHWEEEKQRMWAQGVTWMREKAQYRILLAELRKELEEIKTMLKEKP